jgi:selenocysteine lyase/cysteine desulfurase
LGCSDATRVVETLAEHGIVASARGSGLRVSFHYYNVADDIDALLSVLDSHAELMAPTGG